jgi:hypothetical protein
VETEELRTPKLKESFLPFQRVVELQILIPNEEILSRGSSEGKPDELSDIQYLKIVT